MSKSVEFKNNYLITKINEKLNFTHDGMKVKISLREAAKAIGISPATLCRLSNGNLPDVVTFYKVILWLELDEHIFLFFDVSKTKNP